jgi:TolB-like protein
MRIQAAIALATALSGPWLLPFCSAASAGTATTAGASSRSTLAITYFDNNAGNPAYDPLSRGLAEMLITDLSTLASLQVVERGRLNLVLQELELQKSAFVDPQTAVRVGKGVGAAYVMVGSFSAVEPQMRIDARIVDVSSGEVVKADAVSGPSAEFFLLEKELANTIVQGLDVKLSARESALLGRVATEDFEAFLAWSRGIEAIDRGLLEEARGALEEALRRDDRFALATQQLDALQNKLKELGASAAKISSEIARKMLARIDALQKSGGPWDPLQAELIELSMRVTWPTGSRDLFAITGRLLDAKLSESLKFGGPSGALSINEWALSSYVLSAQQLGKRAEYLTYGEEFLTRYPASAYGASFRMGMSQLIDQIKKEEAGRKLIPAARAKALGEANKVRCMGEKKPKERLESCRAWIRDAEGAGVQLDDQAFEDWARAAAHAGDIGEIEQARARAVQRDRYSESAEDIQEILDRAKRDGKEADEALAVDLPKAEKPYQLARVVDDLMTAGRQDEARRVVEDGLRRWPAADEIHDVAVRLACYFSDLKGAEAALERWEAAEAQGAKVNPDRARLVREMPEQMRWAQEADAHALMALGREYQSIDQYKLAGDAWAELGRKHSTFSAMDGGTALTLAAGMYRMAWEVDACRAAYQEIVDRFPDSQSAGSARTMLETLPP